MARRVKSKAYLEIVVNNIRSMLHCPWKNVFSALPNAHGMYLLSVIILIQFTVVRGTELVMIVFVIVDSVLLLPCFLIGKQAVKLTVNGDCPHRIVLGI